MFKYSQTLIQLTQQMQQLKSDDSLYCLSVYLPFDQGSHSSPTQAFITTQFKSLVEGEVQKHLGLPEQKQLRLSIVEEISLFSSSFDLSQTGVCVYATFRTGTLYRGDNKKISQNELVPFIQAVPLFTLFDKKSSAFVGKVFDLMPLLDNLNFDNPLLVIDFHQDEALLYEFSQMQLKLLSYVENSYVKFPEREEYLDQGQANHSNRKDRNYTEDYLHQFLRDDLNKAVSNFFGEYKTLILVCPVEYLPQINKFITELGPQFSEIQTLHLTTNKTSELIHKHISEITKNRIKDIRQITQKELSSPLKKIETDVQVILEASQMGKVEMLYVVPYYHTAGFVDGNDDGQIEMTLLIIQNVIEFGGKVVSISNDMLDDKSKTIFANFRF